MARYRVHLTNIIEWSVEVEAPDDADPEEVYEKTYDLENPELCGQCSGWGQKFKLSLGEEWEPVPVSPKDSTPHIEKIED